MEWLLTTFLALIAVSFPAEGTCPAGTPWLPKCCPYGQIKTRGGCSRGGSGVKNMGGVCTVVKHPGCTEMYALDRDVDDFRLFHNGSLLLVLEDGLSTMRSDFCLEEDPANVTLTFLCFPQDDDDDEDEEVKKKEFEMYSVGIFISLPFIFSTFLVYYNIKKVQNFHGKCIRSYTLSLSLSYLFLGTVQNGLIQREIPCILLGYAIQFFFMATFFWLNVMCFDIYWAFSGLRNLTGSVREREKKKLILYSIYAWCTPLLILVITVAVDLSPSIPNNSVFKPQVGVDKCFFKEKTATWIYFYLPMALIIISNIFLFAVTAYRIWSHRKEAAVLKKVDSRKHDSTNDKESLIYIECEEQNYLPWYTEPKTSTEKYLFTLYLKLFVVMGINWVMELLSSIVGGPGYLWYIPDFTNTLQGVFIFLIFVWKKRVRKLVWAKICSCFGKKPVISNTRTNWSGSTRNTTNSTDSTRTNSVRLNPANTVSQSTIP